MRTGKTRIGSFLIFIGLILLVIFFAINQAAHPNYAYFCVGLLAVILGGIFLVRGHKPPAESMRFRTLRRWREQQRQMKEERNKKP